MVTRETDPRDDDREHDEHERKTAVETSGLESDPRVEEANDLSSLVGIGAPVLRGTGVADVRLSSIADEAALVVVLEGPEMLALRALPGVQVRVVVKAGDAEAQGAAVSVAGEGVDREGGAEEKAGVGRGEQCFRPDAAHEPGAAWGSAGSVISVKRMSSGSSSVTRGTV